MQSSLVGLAGLIYAAGIRPMLSRKNAQGARETREPTVADRPAGPNRASDGTKSQRPTIIQGPGYNKGIAAPSR